MSIQKTAIEAAGMTVEEFERSIQLKLDLQREISEKINATIRGHVENKSASVERVHSLVNAALCNLTIGHYVGCFLNSEPLDSLKTSYLRAQAAIFDMAVANEIAKREKILRENAT